MISCLRQAAASVRENERREDFSPPCGKALLNEGAGDPPTLVCPRAREGTEGSPAKKSIVLLDEPYKGGDWAGRGRLAQGLLTAEVRRK